MYTLTNTSTKTFPSLYVLSLLRTPSGLAALTSDQRLTVLDPSTLAPSTPLPLNHGATTSAAIQYDGSIVCTAGEDGQIALWDLRAPSQVSRFQATQTPILSLAASPITNTIAAGAEFANHTSTISIWDIRSQAHVRTLSDLHSDDITSLAFHPSTPSTLLSSSTDGLISAHNLLEPDEDEMTLSTFNLTSPVARAGWLGESVWALSHDERFAVYDAGETNFGDLRPRLGCRYVADVVAKGDATGAILGAGAQDQGTFQLVFLSRQGIAWGLDDNVVDLPGAHREDIVRAFVTYDEEQVVFTAGEDGSVKAWRPS